MKKIFGFVAVVATVAAINVNIASTSNIELTSLQMENLDALAQETMTSEEFTAKTDCIACWDNHKCKVYTYAHRK